VANVVDSLVVTLGLDSKAFASGVQGSTEQLASFTRRLSGMFLAVRGLEDVIDYFKDLHHQLAEVGFAARNLNVTGVELTRLGEVARLFGGQASDAIESVQGLQAAIFNLRFRGQMSDQLAMLQRFGVAYLDAAGKMRSFRDIARDAAAAIDRQARVAGLGQGERYQMALSMGFSGGIASAVAQGGAGLERALSESGRDQKSLTERSIQSQVRLDQDLTRLQSATAANSAALLQRMTPAIEAATTELRKLAETVIPYLTRKLDEIEGWFKNPPAWLKSIEDHLKSLEHLLGPTGSLVAALGALTFGLGAGGALVRMLGTLVASLALAPSRLGAQAVGGLAPLLGRLGLVGLAGAAGYEGGKFLTDTLPKMLGAKEGLGEWLGGALFDLLHQEPYPELTEQHVTAQRIGAPPKPHIASLPTPTAPRPAAATAPGSTAAHVGGAPPTAMAGSAVTNVQIDSITVNTRATDAQGIAHDLRDAVRRKFLVSQADPGLA